MNTLYLGGLGARCVVQGEATGCSEGDGGSHGNNNSDNGSTPRLLAACRGRAPC